MAIALPKVLFFDLGDTLITANRQWVPDAKGTLTQLRDKGFRLGLISNTGNLSRAQLVAQILPPDFDLNLFEAGLVIFSSEVHLEKPDPRIFRKALQQAHVPAKESLFCTEELRHSLVAQLLGMRTIRLQKPPLSEIANLAAELEWLAMQPLP